MTQVLLLSGGIDSAAMAAWCKPDVTLFIDYGQLPSQGELRAAKAIAKDLKLPLHILTADCSATGSGMLVGYDQLPQSPSKEWWPFRNQLLITLAGAWAFIKGIQEIIVGAVKSDGFHVDGTSEFYRIIDSLMFLQEGGIRIKAPAIEMTSIDLIRISEIPIDVLGWAHSCHQNDWACGICPGCIKHSYIKSELRNLSTPY